MRRPSLNRSGNRSESAATGLPAPGPSDPRPGPSDPRPRQASLKRIKWPPMARPGVPGNKVRYYVGDEVCYSPMFGLATLFVVGIQPASEIIQLAAESKSYNKPVNHIYLGANRSCDYPKDLAWNPLVDRLLRKTDLYVSLEIDVSKASLLADWTALEGGRFCPVFTLKLPKAHRFGNAALRIDDAAFLGDNGGVWTHAVADLIEPEAVNFSPWRWFSKDKVIE